jgi:ABC-type transport system involved in multi-copper enzyme maturation permease subunit
MIKTVVRRELLDNILSFKFMASVLVVIVLVVISTLYLADDYLDRLKDFDKGMANAREYLSKIPVYSYLEVGIYKSPSPLSVFVSGIERNTGNRVTLTHREIPTELEGGLVKNEFSRIFSFFDLSSVIVVVFTILAILLSYDSVSGEKESGMLSLALSQAVPRHKFLLGKYLGGLFSLLVPLSFCFLLALFIVLFVKGVSPPRNFLGTVFLFFLLSVLYLSAVLLVGIFISSRTKTSFHSLILLLAFYLITVFLVPLGLSSYARNVELRTARNFEMNAAGLVRERTLKIAAERAKLPTRRTWASMEARGEKFILKRMNPEVTIEYYKRYHEMRERIVVDFAQRIYELKRKDLQAAEKIQQTKAFALAFFPSANFAHASELAAETGRENLTRFFEQISLYWHQLVRYLEGKDAFSLRYFYPYPEKFNPEENAFLAKFGSVMGGQKWAQYQDELNKYNQKVFGFLDLGDLPVFEFHDSDLAARAGRVLPNAFVLFFYNFLFFILAYFSFRRYDPRALM